MLRIVTVEIRVLGPIEVRTAAGVVTAGEFRSKKSQRVFEVLALAGGQTVTKDGLIDTLWRRRAPVSPAATVEVAVSLLRSTLDRIGAAGVVLTEPGGYRLDPGSVTIDVLEFDRALVAAERLDDVARVELLRGALMSVRGTLLEDEPALDWLAPHRDRARRRVELARLMLGRSALACGDDTSALEIAELAWTAADVVLEDAYAIGAQALVAQGRRSQAVALLAEADARLARERSTTAGPALLAVRQQLERPFELRGGAAPVTIGDELRGVPWPLPFLGRAEVVARVDAAVRAVRSTPSEPAARVAGEWLHLTGRRGMGKSRTLEQIEDHLHRTYPRVTVHRLACHEGDSVVGSLLVARLARSSGVAEAPVDGELFRRLAAHFDAAGATVVLVDDVDRADSASLAVMRSLVASGGAASLVVVTTGGEVPDGADAVPLPLLTAEELAIVGGEAVWRATAGHPTVLSVCARAASTGGVLDVGGTQDLGALVGEMGPIVTQVVRLAARSMDPPRVEDVSALMFIAPVEVAGAVDALVEAGFASVTHDGGIEITLPLLRALFLH